MPKSVASPPIHSWPTTHAAGWDGSGAPWPSLDAVPQELAATLCAWAAYEGVARRKLVMRLTKLQAPLPAARRG